MYVEVRLGLIFFGHVAPRTAALHAGWRLYIGGRGVMTSASFTPPSRRRPLRAAVTSQSRLSASFYYSRSSRPLTSARGSCLRQEHAAEVLEECV